MGLEFSLKKLQKVGFTGILVGTIQLAIVFSLGYVIAMAFDWTHLEALFLGSILSITSTAISLRFLRDLNLVNTNEWNTVVIILIVEDLAAVLLLTILGDATKGDGFAFSNFGRIILHVEDVDKTYDHLKQSPFSDRIETSPTNAEWGERFFYIRDPDNHQIAIAKPL